MKRNTRKILQEHRPPLEEEILDYLESMFDETIDSESSCDRTTTLESIQSTLEQLVDIPTTKGILLELSEAMGGNDSLGMDVILEDSVEANQELTHKQARTLGQSLSSTPTVLQTDSTPSCTNTVDDTNHPTKQKEQRRQRREAKREKKLIPNVPKKNSVDLIDDHESAWRECQEEGRLWGGRGLGGRGVQYTGENYDNIHLPSVSLHFEGNELLVDSPMDIVRGHRYGLLGRNGVGKSTLLRQLAAHGIPGLPHGMRTLLVQQHVQGRDDQTTLQALVEADTIRTSLLQEMDRVEADIELGVDLKTNSQRLGEIVSELDAVGADDAEDRAIAILKGLSFTKSMMEGNTSSLSGGWRMRLALAQALFVPQSDLILLDECTNHLDLHGMSWLIQYLTNEDKKAERTLIVVSHDREFLDAICTDIVVLEHQRLNYHVGSFSEYERQIQEKNARQAQILDASERQRNKALAFVQEHQHSKKSSDPNKQRQAKMIREKKLDRIGNYREDGKRYKQFSLKKLDASYIQTAEQVHIERQEAVLKLHFPHPTWPPGVPEGSPLVQLEEVSFRYDCRRDPQLKHLTLNISRGRKIALVGNNGSGKSTLITLITKDLDATEGVTTGNLWKHPNVRFGHVTQYAVEELEVYSSMTVVEYAEKNLSSRTVASRVIQAASGNVRQYLGGFGLGGAHALRTVGTLSGGERMRLCFATILADEPHVLFLDESTNHVDLETLDSIAVALRDYQGAVLMVSHNQGFLSTFCNELWVLENGQVEVNHNDTKSFDDLFSRYRNHILSTSATTNRQNTRKQTATLARKATAQAAGTRKGTTLYS